MGSDDTYAERTHRPPLELVAYLFVVGLGVVGFLGSDPTIEGGQKLLVLIVLAGIITLIVIRFRKWWEQRWWSP